MGLRNTSGRARAARRDSPSAGSLPASPDLLRATLKALPDLLFVTDRRGRFLAWHAPDPAALYATPARFLGRHLQDVLPAPAVKILRAAMQKALARGRARSAVYPLPAPAGKLHWYECAVSVQGARRAPDARLIFLARDVTARKQAEETLRRSEAKYRLLFDSLRDGVVVVDMDRHIVETNAACRAMTGYAARELRNMTTPDVFAPPWQPEIDRIRHKQILARGFSDLYEVAIRRKDGGVLSVETIGMLLRDENGQPAGIWAVFRDIARRKRAEEALKASEAKYRLLFEHMLDGVAITDLRGRMVDCNPAFEQIVGRSRAELRGVPFRKFTPVEYVAAETRAIRRLQVQKEPGLFEKEYLRKDGTRVPVEIQGSFIHDDAGRATGMMAVVRDIADRKRAEKGLRQAHDQLEKRVAERTAELQASRNALAQSEEQFRQMAESIQEVFYLIDARTLEILYASPAFKSIWGRPEWSRKPRFQDWAGAIHPDDREQNVREFRAGVATGKFVRQEYRIVRPDGEVRRIADQAWPIRDAHGRMIRIAGVIRDVTEHRRLEMEILHAGEAERQRIGRDLHDGLGQTLAAVRYAAQALRSELVRRGRPEAPAMRRLEHLIGRTVANARTLSHSLLPLDLKRGGLAEALRTLAANITDLFRIPCRFSGSPRPAAVGLDVAGQLYRIAQEAATNAAKHSRTGRIDIRLVAKRAGLLLTVRDAGRGLPPPPRRTGGLGLDIMRYRAGLIGATFWIDTRRNGGTAVNCLARPGNLEG